MTKITLEIPEKFAEFCKEQSVEPENVLNAFMIDLAGREEDGHAEAWFWSIIWHDQNERSYTIEDYAESHGYYLVKLFDCGKDAGEAKFVVESSANALRWWDGASISNRNYWLVLAQEKYPDIKATVEMAHREYAIQAAYEEAYNYGENWDPS